jgi:hypothetical protein
MYIQNYGNAFIRSNSNLVKKKKGSNSNIFWEVKIHPLRKINEKFVFKL